MQPTNAPTRETALTIGTLAVLAIALWGPAMVQPPGAHDLADQRALGGVPFALDVGSSLALAAAALAGWRAAASLPPRTISNMQRAMARLLFSGLLLTAAGCAWYHAHPDAAGLALARTMLGVAWAGLLGLAVATHVSERAAAAIGLLALLLGPLAVRTWLTTGNLLPWSALQAGGIMLVSWLGLLRQRHGAPHVRWPLVVFALLAAKLLDLSDREVFGLSRGLVSGHALTHLAMALAAAPVVAALGGKRPRGGPGWRPGPSRIGSQPFGDA